MICRIQGKIAEKGDSWLLVENGGLTYEVLLPVTSMQRLEASASIGSAISLITYHYYHIEPSRSFPILIGFLSEVEKEFFLAFITVSGIGPKAALRALSQPISQIARAIDEGDIPFLKSLPGIGQQRAKEIVAKLQNKVGKFGLLMDATQTTAPQKTPAADIKEEALEVLMQLGYKKQEALQMVATALEKGCAAHTAEELLNEVYKQKKTVL